MNVIADTLKKIEVVSTIMTYDDLVIHFLRLQQGQDLNVLSFKEAIDAGALEITEIGDGIVEELCFNNSGNKPVFIPEGTIIENLKQNRFVRVSFIINGNAILGRVPTACVEASRWAYENNRMGNPSTYHLFPSLRAMNSRAIRRSLKLNRGYESFEMQRETWNQIDSRLKSTKSNSRTKYVGDYLKDSQKQVNDLMRGIFIPDEVNGFIALFEGKPIELTIMGSYQLFSTHAQGLMTGIAVDCFDEGYRKSLRRRKEMSYRDFMDSISQAKMEQYPSVGAGQDLRFESKELIGSALLNERIVYLGAYSI